MKSRIKQYIKEILPPFTYYLTEPTKGLIHKIMNYRSQWVTYYRPSVNNRFFVLGNGPSLNVTLEKYLEILKKEECAVVNFFGITDYFPIIKPQWYILSDPAFFQSKKNLSDKLLSQINSLHKVLENDLTWKINFCVPISYKRSEFITRISKIENIKIFYFNSNGNSNKLKNNIFKYKLWNHNLLSPLMQTVLNTAIQLGIMMKYKEIYLVGADTSWHTSFEVDQQTNQLYSIDTHFYGNKRIPRYKDNNNTPCRLHEQLKLISIALENYWILADYAKYTGIKIYNSSEISWIDAFERKKLDNIDQNQSL